MSSDKWRFDPQADYSSDEYGEGKNFQRFHNKPNKKKSKGHKGGHGSKKGKRDFNNDSWR